MEDRELKLEMIKLRMVSQLSLWLFMISYLVYQVVIR